MSSYIKVSRSILEWGWYHDIKTFRLFMHMLLKANWKDGKFGHTTVPRGSFVSSIKKLSEETNLTTEETRTALEHLCKTGEVTKQTTSKFSLYSLKNYNFYQSEAQAEPKQSPNKAQAEPKQSPSRAQAEPKQSPTIEEGKKERKGRREEGKKTSTGDFEVSQAIEAWNCLEVYGVNKVSKVSKEAKRFKMLKARIREHGLEEVLRGIEHIKHSKFLQGKAKAGQGRETPFLITLDWFVCPNNFQKVLDGNYNDRADKPDEWEEFFDD